MVESTPMESSLPSRGARFLAFGAILLGGLCGGLIGWKVTALQVDGSGWAGLGAVVGAVLAAFGVGVVAVLTLRAMGEWSSIRSSGDPAAGRRR